MVRLNSIKDAFNYAKRDKYLVTDTAWTQDSRKTYQVGQISEKTGLQKQPDGSWAEPGKNQNSSSLKIEKTTWRVPRSLGAKAVKYTAKNDTEVEAFGKIVTLKEGSEVTDIEVIAKGHGIKTVQKLIDKYTRPNGTKTAATDWIKKKGNGTVETANGTNEKAELHWYECKGLGKVKFKVKKWI